MENAGFLGDFLRRDRPTNRGYARGLMKILMYGWEFPPLLSGGLGIACYGIVRSLLQHPTITINLVLPTINDTTLSHNNLNYIDVFHQHPTTHFKVKPISALLHPYLTNESYHLLKKNTPHDAFYGKDLLTEVYRYTAISKTVANEIEYDIIHAHDWLTVLAGCETKALSGKPLVFHVHALETDRSPNNMNSEITTIEKKGLETADAIIAVSEYTKNNIIRHYGISPEKIFVVYNGIFNPTNAPLPSSCAFKNYPIILFLGRITEQKGAYFFIKAAEKILAITQEVEFVIAGDGDQLPAMIREMAQLGISHKIHFTGFLERGQVEKIFQMSDIYVMPSVSEPFGISCLEALSYNLPVIISKQSGVNEVIKNSLKVDFWDIDQLANYIMALLNYPAIKSEMLLYTKKELEKLTWKNAVKNIMHVYNAVTAENAIA